MGFPPVPLDGPVVLRVAADALCGPIDYANDQCWELVAGGDPAGLALTTSYGRRAAAMRIFASFGMGGPVVSDPAVFAAPPLVESVLPSAISLRFAPLAGLEVRSEMRVVDSHSLAGRITLTNATDRFRPMRLGLHATLLPTGDGQGILPRTFSGATALAGRCGNLEPVVFLAGGAIEEPGLSAALLARVDLAPGASRAFSWGEAALASGEDSFERARQVAGRSWDGEMARLERTHDRWVEVHCGDADWDLVFHMTQQSALAGLVGPGPVSERLSLVTERSPQRGFSPGGDGRDHSEGWNGPSVLEAYAVLSQLRWAAPQAAADVLRSFWESQGLGGEIDARPGLAGQRARLLCPPLLAPLTLKVYQSLQDRSFLEEGFRALWLSSRAWMSPAHDRDGDGWPEWDHGAHPPWPVLWTAGGPDAPMDTTVVEDPALAALLYREADALLAMAERLGRVEAVQELTSRQQQLRGVLQRGWDAARRTFRRIERETHKTTQAHSVASGRGAGLRKARGRLPQATRLTLRVAAEGTAIPGVHARIRGRVESGRVRVDALGREAFRWRPAEGVAISELVFASVESVEMIGLPEGVDWQAAGLGLEREDLSLMLPLWAGMVEADQARAIVGETLLAPARYLRPYGLSSVPADDPDYAVVAADPRGGVNPALNLMLGEALVGLGYRREAADVLGRLMRAVAAGLRREHAFFEAYHPDTGEGLGHRHDGRGLALLSLFLEVLGVDFVSTDLVRLEGESPFEHAVARWRGVTVERGPAQTRVEFSDAGSAVVEGAAPVFVERTEDGGRGAG
ncbi:MAG TPA: hypothetical protein VK449_01280 [Anaerolineales bacterium]|nr:hypothetical protein [Anaerolineales bacterium]